MGRAYDRPFDAAFAKPKYFGAYGPSFRGVLEPRVKVPFGAGWIDVPVDFEGPAQYVRITIDSFWAMGGGLNEVQVYSSAE